MSKFFKAAILTLALSSLSFGAFAQEDMGDGDMNGAEHAEEAPPKAEKKAEKKAAAKKKGKKKGKKARKAKKH
ncbi:MAG: hypothetical protein KDD61_17025 [Bdellovibrionales bacterium]|nr:hypothetical protein [Bdellovibrionales bacterium]